MTVHQLSKRQSQCPFRKLAGPVQRVVFHPSKPIFYVAVRVRASLAMCHSRCRLPRLFPFRPGLGVRQTQRFVRVYNLMKQELVQTLHPNMKWISSLDVHPKGDNVIVGSYDKRLSWFDTELSTQPYKVLRFHTQAIRRVAFHPRYPLFASCSDDNTIHVFHGMVYNDLLQNPLIVPVKILKGHRNTDSLGTAHADVRHTRAGMNVLVDTRGCAQYDRCNHGRQVCWTASSTRHSHGSSARARTRPSACTHKLLCRLRM